MFSVSPHVPATTTYQQNEWRELFFFLFFFFFPHLGNQNFQGFRVPLGERKPREQDLDTNHSLISYYQLISSTKHARALPITLYFRARQVFELRPEHGQMMSGFTLIIPPDCSFTNKIRIACCLMLRMQALVFEKVEFISNRKKILGTWMRVLLVAIMAPKAIAIENPVLL